MSEGCGTDFTREKKFHHGEHGGRGERKVASAKTVRVRENLYEPHAPAWATAKAQHQFSGRANTIGTAHAHNATTHHSHTQPTRTLRLNGATVCSHGCTAAQPVELMNHPAPPRQGRRSKSAVPADPFFLHAPRAVECRGCLVLRVNTHAACKPSAS